MEAASRDHDQSTDSAGFAGLPDAYQQVMTSPNGAAAQERTQGARHGMANGVNPPLRLSPASDQRTTGPEDQGTKGPGDQGDRKKKGSKKKKKGVKKYALLS